MIGSVLSSIFALVLAHSSVATAGGETLLVRDPTRSADALCFVYAGDLWIARPDGSDARRLTVLPTVESDPRFSPDGKWIAFTGQYEGNADVYVVPVEGGDPARLTYHPGPDQVRGWTTDGSKVMFRSGRDSSMRNARLWVMDRTGGFPEALPLPMAERGSFAPDGRRLAYTPIADAFGTWKRYRGGMSGGIWIFDSWTHEIEKVPRERSNDTMPVWLGNTLYFLSDRNRTMNVFTYDPVTYAVNQVTQHTDYDVRSLSAGPGMLVYEQGGRIHELDPATGASKPLAISIAADLPARRPHFVDAKEWVSALGISPTGKRALIEARGEILSVPAKKGSWRNLTQGSGAHDRDPAWSPDGKTIACFSDASGEYQLLLYPQDGLSQPRAIGLGDPPSFFYEPTFSPDGKKILCTDKRMNARIVDLEAGSSIVVDTDTYDHPERTLDPTWSPDGRWVAYTKRLDNHLRALFLYDVAAATTHQVTDGLSDATSACFSRDGKYLYFAASTDFGLNAAWLDMTSIDRPTTRSLYLAVLSSEEPSPFLPESDEEGAAEKKKDEADAKKTEEKDAAADAGSGAEAKDAPKEESAPKPIEPIRVDLQGLDQRILALPLPPGHYGELRAADGGALLYLDTPPEGGPSTLSRFDLAERKSEPSIEGIEAYALSGDGKQIVYAIDGTVGIVEATGKHTVGDGKLALDSIQIRVEPVAEWRQIFHEAWRIERDYFYDPAMHGLDWAATRTLYEPFLAHVAHRSDLNYVLAEMIGEMVVGHNYVGGGDQPTVKSVPVGLLGADFVIDSGRYRITRIFNGENWNPELRAPLTGPGIDARVGDYILSIDGRPLVAPENIYARFEGAAGRPVVLQLNGTAAPEGARSVTVVPIGSEGALRQRAWIEDNRRKVSELSGGRVAYVYLPDTAGGGYSYFTRYFFAQLGCDAAVIDERFNGGGLVADYIVDLLNRPLLSWWATREGKPFQTPLGSILGPKVMLINEYAGSGGDALPNFFRRRGIGKLVGKRTWGGLVGIYDYPALIDGGFLTSPRVAIFSPDGQWEVENEGVPPDVEVDILPKDWIGGHDMQLEKAVEIVLAELDAHPIQRASRPAPPVRVR